MKRISILDWCGWYGVCKDCDQPVSHYTCNEELIDKRPEAVDWDWWSSCDNEKCKNNYGEGIFQDTPEWELR